MASAMGHKRQVLMFCSHNSAGNKPTDKVENKGSKRATRLA